MKENLDYNEARGRDFRFPEAEAPVLAMSGVPLDHLQEEVLDWANCQDPRDGLASDVMGKMQRMKMPTGSGRVSLVTVLWC